MYEDKTLVCKDCGNEFVFTAGEQEFYASRGFENEPQISLRFYCHRRRDARAGRTPAVAPARCSPLCVPPAARKPACLSSIQPGHWEADQW